MAKEQPAPHFSQPHGLSDPLAPGLRLAGARYILRRVLGRGAATVVWLARDVKLEQEVALKILPESLLQDPNNVERLKTETLRNIQLSHPNIARTYDFVKDLRLAAISTEYVEGWSLAALRVDKPEKRFRLEEITPWIRALCAALEYAHTNAGMTHGDLKPSNLMLNDREELKVTNFGTARSLHGMAVPTDLNRMADTLGFMSPQQALGEKPSVLDDVYGLGAVIYDLLTGTPPFYKGQILAQVCERTPPSITGRLGELGINESIPLVVEDTVALCLAKDPKKRPQSIAEVLQLLQRSEVPRTVESVTGQRGEKATSEVMPHDKPSQASGYEAGQVPDKVAAPSLNRRDFIWPGVLTGALVVLGLSSWLWATRGSRGSSRQSAPAGSLDASINPGQDNTPPKGFVALFNGKDLTGWKGLLARPNDNPAIRAKLTPEALAKEQAKADQRMRDHWKAENGQLVFDGKGDSLATKKDYGDFEMLVDWKIPPRGDSGVYLRGSPQVQIWEPNSPGQFNPPDGSGGLYNNQKNPRHPLTFADRPVGEWNHFRILMVGEKVHVYLNDELVVRDTTLENYWEREKPIYPAGQIELQNHGGQLWFKNIYIREIPREKD